jgi:uncharacterized protein YndB with AHSA1/START domain
VEPLLLEFTVACPVERAFDLWARETSRWWPTGHSVSADPGLSVTFEPRPGGRIYERTPDGDEHDWGEVLVWEPPRRLEYLWHLRFDRSDATEVAITFAEAGDTTMVSIVHRGWERLGAAGPERRERNRRGWAGVIEHYREACSSPG